MSFLLTRRGGAYHRVADPLWENPLDGTFSLASGGRWNPAGSFPVVYLNKTVEVARANVWRKLAGLPYGPEDLDPEAAPHLVTTEVPEDRIVDAVTGDGCKAAGLPPTFPWEADGERVPWETCQRVGQRAWDRDLPGIVCRSAAPDPARERRSPGEELAWFERARKLKIRQRHRFEEWFWPDAKGS